MPNLFKYDHFQTLEEMAARCADFEPQARRFNRIAHDPSFNSVGSGMSRAMRAQYASPDGLLISSVLSCEIRVRKPLYL
jgi:hypothetical protein